MHAGVGEAGGGIKYKSRQELQLRPLSIYCVSINNIHVLERTEAKPVKIGKHPFLTRTEILGVI